MKNTNLNIRLAFERLSAWEGIPNLQRKQLLDSAEVLSLTEQTILTRQYYPANDLYFVWRGSLDVYIQLDHADGRLCVASVQREWSAVGWSGFREPHRYAADICCEQPCQVLRWTHAQLQDVFAQYPDLACAFLNLVRQTAEELLRQSRQRLAQAARPYPCRPLQASQDDAAGSLQLAPDTVLSWLQRSAFFEHFSEKDLRVLAGRARLQSYRSGQRLQTESKCADGIFMLVSGGVAHYLSAAHSSTTGEVLIRTLDSPGQIVSWSLGRNSLADSRLSTIMSQDSLLCFIRSSDVLSLAAQHVTFSVMLSYRLLALLGTQLRSTRAQLLHQQYEEESFCIRNLLEQASPQLGVCSLLHEIPHLLDSRLTHGRVFDTLEKVKQQGDPLEKNLAGVCSDILTETRREWRFYQGLLNVYETVVTSPAELAAPEVRARCVAAFQQAYSQVRYVIKGHEFLPREPGQIFILNHLISHPYHILPNHFELALDTHFVSSMILAPAYGDGGVRVVRQPRHEEYAHQDYYTRLGNISVVTRESAADRQQTSTHRLATFIERARHCLQSKQNLVICPEGTSLWSEESPGPFKPGAFILAGRLSPGPSIVPVALANFDRRLRHTTLAAVIKPPFYITDHVDVNDRDALSDFLSDYQHQFRGYVEEAQALAQTAGL